MTPSFKSLYFEVNCNCKTRNLVYACGKLVAHSYVCNCLGSVSQSRFSENPAFINPEMRETLGFPFHKGR